MEKRIFNNKVKQDARTSYFQTFKDDIKDNILDIKDIILELGINKKQAAQLLQYIYDYQPLEFEKTDFQKRKRIKKCCSFL